MHNVTRIVLAAVLLWMTPFSPTIASEPVPAAPARPRPSDHAAPILIDGRAQNYSFVLGGDLSRGELVQASGTTTCSGTTLTGVPFSIECPSVRSYTRSIHVADVFNRVTVVIPEAASRFGPLDELLDVSQEGTSVLVSTSRTSKRVLIYAQADTTVNRNDPTLGTTELDTTLTVQFADLPEATRPVTEGIANLAVNGRYYSYRIGRVTAPASLRINIEIGASTLGIPFWLLRRSLTNDEFTVENEGDHFSRVIIDLSKLGLVRRLRGKSVYFDTTTTLELPLAGLANSSDLPPMSMRRDWGTKLPKDWCQDCQ